MNRVMSDQVLSDDVLSAIAVEIASTGATMVTSDYGRAVERAVVAALAQRSGVDVEALAYTAAFRCLAYSDTANLRKADVAPVADALRLALATAEARHAEREAMWRELYALIDRWPTASSYASDSKRHAELRRALGLEG